jgi:hypothetical protein
MMSVDFAWIPCLLNIVGMLFELKCIDLNDLWQKKVSLRLLQLIPEIMLYPSSKSGGYGLCNFTSSAIFNVCRLVLVLDMHCSYIH